MITLNKIIAASLKQINSSCRKQLDALCRSLFNLRTQSEFSEQSPEFSLDIAMVKVNGEEKHMQSTIICPRDSAAKFEAEIDTIAKEIFGPQVSARCSNSTCIDITYNITKQSVRQNLPINEQSTCLATGDGVSVSKEDPSILVGNDSSFITAENGGMFCNVSGTAIPDSFKDGKDFIIDIGVDDIEDGVDVDGGPSKILFMLNHMKKNQETGTYTLTLQDQQKEVNRWVTDVDDTLVNRKINPNVIKPQLAKKILTLVQDMPVDFVTGRPSMEKICNQFLMANVVLPELVAQEIPKHKETNTFYTNLTLFTYPDKADESKFDEQKKFINIILESADFLPEDIKTTLQRCLSVDDSSKKAALKDARKLLGKAMPTIIKNIMGSISIDARESVIAASKAKVKNLRVITCNGHPDMAFTGANYIDQMCGVEGSVPTILIKMKTQNLDK